MKGLITDSEKEMEMKLRQLAELLICRKITISVAESCTGGWIAKCITDMPGSSSYFKGSAVTYWNEAKENILYVKRKTLDDYTAVSEAVAEEMAEGSRAIYHSDIAISTTGYAGPGRGERGEMPGLVYIGVAGVKGIKVYQEHFSGDRNTIREKAVMKSIEHAITYICSLKQS